MFKRQYYVGLRPKPYKERAAKRSGLQAQYQVLTRQTNTLPAVSLPTLRSVELLETPYINPEKRSENYKLPQLSDIFREHACISES